MFAQPLQLTFEPLHPFVRFAIFVIFIPVIAIFVITIVVVAIAHQTDFRRYGDGTPCGDGRRGIIG